MQKNAYGFTIVELLIVIAVIGILGAITLVAYNGVQNRATAALLKSDLNNASKKLDLFKVTNGFYPSTVNCEQPDSLTNTCIEPSNGVTYEYTASSSNPSNYCLTAAKGPSNYNINQSGLASGGPCPVMGLDAGDVASYAGTGTDWLDLGGGNNNVTLVNGVAYSTANGGLLSFDGVNDYGIVSNNFVSNPTSLTISSWFKKTHSNGTYNCVLHKGSNTSIGASEYWLGADVSGYLTATIGARTGVGWSAGQTSTLATTGTWWNLAASWDGSVVRVYINGELDKQYNLTSYSGVTTPTRVGASSNGANYQFPGSISTVNIYDRALSAGEIKENFDNTKGRYGL